MHAKTRKTLLIILAILLLAGGGLMLLAGRLDGIVAGLIETQGSAATGTEVSVSGVSIELRDASASIAGLAVANPDGFGRDPAIELGRFAVTIDPATVLDDTVVLRSVTVAGARLRIVQDGARNNLRALLDNLQRDAGPEPAAADSPAKKIVIERFVLEDARASLQLPDGGDAREVTLPTITLEGIGRQSNGVTAAAATRQLLRPIIRRALESAAAQSLKDRAEEKIDEAKDSLLQGLKDSLGQGDDSQ